VTLIARPATPGSWCDTNQRVTLEGARALVAAGYKGVGLYVGLPGNAIGNDVTAEMLTMVTGEGLEVLLFQHVRGQPPAHPLWSPVDHDGAADAATAAARARVAGYPDTAHIAQDLEACDGTSGQVIAYCLRWGRTMVSAVYGAMLYRGYATVASDRELYELPDHNRYASDLGDHQIPVRGTCYLQTKYNVDVGGILKVDTAIMRADLLGDVPTICAAS
jgi:hypothetical protein